jgi:predicted transcriptional regulator
MKVILSIKPKFANKIFDGTKKFEFRRTLFKKKEVKKILVYASAPISKVIGEFEIEDIVHENISTLWDKTSEYSGISLDYYSKYFQGKESGYAIKVKNPTKYEKELCIVKNFGIRPPQSFAYLK